MNNLGPVNYAPPSTKFEKRLELVSKFVGDYVPPLRVVTGTSHLLLDERTLSEGLVISDDGQAVRIKQDGEKFKPDSIAHADTDNVHDVAFHFSRAIDINIPDSHVQLAKAPIRTWLQDALHASIICLSPVPSPQPKGVPPSPAPNLELLLGLQSPSVLLECLSAAFASPAATIAPGIALWCWELDSAACEQYAADVHVLNTSSPGHRARDASHSAATVGDPAGSWRNLLAEVLQSEGRTAGTALFGGCGAHATAGAHAGPGRGWAGRGSAASRTRAASIAASWGSRGLTVATMAEAVGALHAAFRRSRVRQAHRGDSGAVPHLFVRLGLQLNGHPALAPAPAPQKPPVQRWGSATGSPARASRNVTSDQSSAVGTPPPEPIWTTCDIAYVSYTDGWELSSSAAAAGSTGSKSGRHTYSRSSSGSGRYATLLRSVSHGSGSVLGTAGELLAEVVARQDDDAGISRPLVTTQPGRPGSALTRRLAALTVGGVVPHVILALPPRAHKTGSLPHSPHGAVASKSPLGGPRTSTAWLREVLKLGSGLQTIRGMVTLGAPPPALYVDKSGASGPFVGSPNGHPPLPLIGALSGCQEGDRALAGRLLRSFYLEQATAAAAAELRSSSGGSGGGSGDDGRGPAAVAATAASEQNGADNAPSADRPIVTTFAIATAMAAAFPQSARSKDSAGTAVPAPAATPPSESPHPPHGAAVSTFRPPRTSAEWAAAAAALGDQHASDPLHTGVTEEKTRTSSAAHGRTSGDDTILLPGGIINLQRRLEFMQRARQEREAESQGGVGSGTQTGASGAGGRRSSSGWGLRAVSGSRVAPESPRPVRDWQVTRESSSGSLGSAPAQAAPRVSIPSSVTSTATAAKAAEQRLSALRAKFDSLYTGLVSGTGIGSGNGAQGTGTESLSMQTRQQPQSEVQPRREHQQQHPPPPVPVPILTQTAVRQAPSPSAKQSGSRDQDGYREMHAVRQYRSPTASHKVTPLPPPPPAAMDSPSHLPVNGPASPFAKGAVSGDSRSAPGPTSPVKTRSGAPQPPPTVVGPCVGSLLGCLPVQVRPRFVVWRPHMDARVAATTSSHPERFSGPIGSVIGANVTAASAVSVGMDMGTAGHGYPPVAVQTAVQEPVIVEPQSPISTAQERRTSTSVTSVATPGSYGDAASGEESAVEGCWMVEAARRTAEMQGLAGMILAAYAANDSFQVDDGKLDDVKTDDVKMDDDVNIDDVKTDEGRADDGEVATSDESQAQPPGDAVEFMVLAAQALGVASDSKSISSCQSGVSNGSVGVQPNDGVATGHDVTPTGAELRDEAVTIDNIVSNPEVPLTDNIGAFSMERRSQVATTSDIRAVSLELHIQPATIGAIGTADIEERNRAPTFSNTDTFSEERHDQTSTTGAVNTTVTAPPFVDVLTTTTDTVVTPTCHEAATTTTGDGTPRISQDSPGPRGLESLLDDSEEEDRPDGGSSSADGRQDDRDYANAFAPPTFVPPPGPDVAVFEPRSTASSACVKFAKVTAAEAAAPEAAAPAATFGIEHGSASSVSSAMGSRSASERFKDKGVVEAPLDVKTAHARVSGGGSRSGTGTGGGAATGSGVATGTGSRTGSGVGTGGADAWLKQHAEQLARQNEALMNALERAAAGSDALQARLYELQLEVLEARAASAVASTTHKAEVEGLWKRLRSVVVTGAAAVDAALVAEGGSEHRSDCDGGEALEIVGGPAVAALDALVGAYEEQIEGLQQQIADLVTGQTDLAVLCAEQELAVAAGNAARRRRRQERQALRRAASIAAAAGPTAAAGRAAAAAAAAAALPRGAVAPPLRPAGSPGSAKRLPLAKQPSGKAAQAGEAQARRSASLGPRRRSCESLPPTSTRSPLVSSPTSTGKSNRGAVLSRISRDSSIRSTRGLRPSDFAAALTTTDGSNSDDGGSSGSEAGWLGTGLDRPTHAGVRSSGSGDKDADARWRRCRHDMNSLRIALRLSQHREEQLRGFLRNTQQQLRAALLTARLLAGESAKRRWRDNQITEVSQQLAVARDAGATAAQSRDDAQREAQRLRTENEVLTAQMNEMRMLADAYAKFVAAGECGSGTAQ